jgi:peptidoglycan/LPS O-acetylase OafA/YrhL
MPFDLGPDSPESSELWTTESCRIIGQAKGLVVEEANMSYRTELDGLRAIWVMSIILYHAGITQIGAGYAGVDVFFVISGFLIGGQISED